MQAVSTTRSMARSPNYQLKNIFHYPVSDLALPDRQHSGRVFADADAIKDCLQENLIADVSGQADATIYYHPKGHFFADVARDSKFHGLSFAVVFLNAIWIAVEIDAHAVTVLHLMIAHMFCTYFFVESLVQLLAFQQKRHAVKDRAFIFDFVLMFLVLLETWALPAGYALAGVSANGGSNMRVVTIFRMLRFLKVLRLAKVLRQLPELLIIIRGVFMAYKALVFTVILIGMIVYAGALVFRVLLEGTDLGVRRFSSVPIAMGTLLIEATLSGSKGGLVLREAHSEHPLYAFLMLLYVVLANITMMGVLGGLLVQAVKTVTEVEKAENEMMHLLDQLTNIWQEVLRHDANCDNCISRTEFQDLLEDVDTVAVLKRADVDMDVLYESADFIFDHYSAEGQLTQTQFRKCMLEHRGKQAAKVKDHIQTRRYVHSQLKRVLTPSLREAADPLKVDPLRPPTETFA